MPPLNTAESAAVSAPQEQAYATDSRSDWLRGLRAALPLLVGVIPFALLPFPATLLIWALVSLASLFGIAYLTAARLPSLAGIPKAPWPTWQLALGIFAISAFSEPIIQNFDLGQVNLMIVVAVLYDTVSRTRYAGFATGIAAGFKVTPGLFMIFMLVTITSKPHTQTQSHLSHLPFFRFSNTKPILRKVY